MDDATRRHWRERAAAFAAAEIAPRRVALQAAERIPERLWQGFADAGLFRLGLPAPHGAGGDFRALAGVAEALVAAGGNLGVALSWLSHQLIGGMHIAGQGSPAQRAQWLPRLASGAVTPCLAVSEPGAGAHPKHLSTTATADGDAVVLNGAKAYLTNGPMAGLFLVLAVDGVEDDGKGGGRKRFSVYLVPRQTPGLALTGGVPVDFLKPSPHCGLELTGCRVPAASRLGPAGEAMAAISLPMRRAEDALFAASFAGALDHALGLLAAAPAARDDDGLAELGRLAAAPAALGAVAARAAALLDRGGADGLAEVPLLAAAARDWARTLTARLGALAAAVEAPGPQGAPLAALLRDLEGLGSVAGAAQAIQARKRGQSLIEQAHDQAPSDATPTSTETP